MMSYKQSKGPGQDRGLLMRCMWTYPLFDDVIHDVYAKMFHAQRLDLINLKMRFINKLKSTRYLKYCQVRGLIFVK